MGKQTSGATRRAGVRRRVSTRAPRRAARAGASDRTPDQTGGMYFDETYGKSEKANHNWVRDDVRKLDESGGRNRGRVEKNWRDGKNGDGAEKLEGHFCTRMTTIECGI